MVGRNVLWFFFSAFIKIERRDLVSEIRFAGENENLSTGATVPTGRLKALRFRMWIRQASCYTKLN